MTVELLPHQDTVQHLLKSGRILFGPTGSGKSITSLAYYMENEAPKDLYIITTAMKRDSFDWQSEAALFGIGEEVSNAGILHVDSWQNIRKYVDVENAFFIFDEQRLVGSGVWVKSFYKIVKNNAWILLSATPGDNWLDYIPVFVANGFYKNATDFKMQHVRYGRSRYPKVIGYLGTKKLERLRNEIFVEMQFINHTKRVLNYIDVSYDEQKYKAMIKARWNPWTNEPMVDASELFRCLRRLVSTDPSRLEAVREFLKVHPSLIIFYNFNYELEILRSLADYGVTVREWNGHKKDVLPDKWDGVYLVQYVAGAEGWNCVSTNAMVFYSLTYSFKNFEQSQGRIDRLNTSHSTLYYYILSSNSTIDRGIRNALDDKKDFNEAAFVRNLEKTG